mmetsp:Transcript_64187/g.103747  ORF Transcript_64187/g.103747 Transcript_64187/m.103747 type:complete len:264 (-) Transcript_64187:167-958(-)
MATISSAAQQHCGCLQALQELEGHPLHLFVALLRHPVGKRLYEAREFRELDASVAVVRKHCQQLHHRQFAWQFCDAEHVLPPVGMPHPDIADLFEGETELREDKHQIVALYRLDFDHCVSRETPNAYCIVALASRHQNTECTHDTPQIIACRDTVHNISQELGHNLHANLHANVGPVLALEHPLQSTSVLATCRISIAASHPCGQFPHQFLPLRRRHQQRADTRRFETLGSLFLFDLVRQKLPHHYLVLSRLLVVVSMQSTLF